MGTRSRERRPLHPGAAQFLYGATGTMAADTADGSWTFLPGGRS